MAWLQFSALVAAKRPFFGHGEEHKIPLPLGHAGWQAPVGLRTPLREPSRGACVGSALPGMAEPHDKIKINPQPLRVGNEWHVTAIWPSGHPEEITALRPKPKPGIGLAARARRLGFEKGATPISD